MKKLSLLICMCALVMTSFAQLPNYSPAPDFTVYEINKSTGSIITSSPINLYTWTNAGYPVFIDVFATWCGPCWTYHTAGNFENLYTQYGPNGTNEVRVIGIEGHYGNFASLSGTGADDNGRATQGNWLNGVEYPIAPLNMSPNTVAFDNDYQIGYFPTVYMVCPNRLVFEIGQKTTPVLYAATTSTCPQYDETVADNGLLYDIQGFHQPYFCEATVTPTVGFENVGATNITSAVFTINLDGQTSTFSWTGSLAKYQHARVTLPQISVTTGGNHSYSVAITQINGGTDNDPAWNSTSHSFFVDDSPNSSTLNENFSGGIPSSWAVANDYLFVSNTSSAHGAAVVFNAYSFANSEVDELYLPYEDISNISNPVLHFDLAYRRYNNNSAERLRVLYSTDCGNTWSPLYNKSGQSLATVSSNTTSNYVPSESHWRTELIDLSPIADKEHVIIKFEFKSAYGNNIWVDNVIVTDGTGIAENENEFKIYPIPAHDVLNIATEEIIESVEIYNLQGQLVQVENGNVNTINVSNLATGNYFVRIQTADNTITRKFTKE